MLSPWVHPAEPHICPAIIMRSSRVMSRTPVKGQIRAHRDLSSRKCLECKIAASHFHRPHSDRECDLTETGQVDRASSLLSALAEAIAVSIRLLSSGLILVLLADVVRHIGLNLSCLHDQSCADSGCEQRLHTIISATITPCSTIPRSLVCRTRTSQMRPICPRQHTSLSTPRGQGTSPPCCRCPSAARPGRCPRHRPPRGRRGRPPPPPAPRWPRRGSRST